MNPSKETQLVRTRLVRVSSILQYANPLVRPPWLGIDPISLDEVAVYRDNCFARPSPIPICSQSLPTKRDHCIRIAYLARFGWKDPIDFDCASIGTDMWPIFDGNHRVAAAVFRKDEQILVDIFGSQAQVKEMFGLT